jgi:hypothetical protein
MIDTEAIEDISKMVNTNSMAGEMKKNVAIHDLAQKKSRSEKYDEESISFVQNKDDVDMFDFDPEFENTQDKLAMKEEKEQKEAE